MTATNITPLRIGLDVGSTTVKIVILDSNTQQIHVAEYQRHYAEVFQTLTNPMTNINTDIHVQIPHRAPEFPMTDKERFTILCPQMAPIHFSLCVGVFRQCGYNLVVLPTVNRETIEEGLRYVNNDVCYPAIVVVGQLIQALKSGQYDPAHTALLISQTCGGCRSTNYATFLKIAVNKAGFPDVPVIPFQVNITNDNNNGLYLPVFSLKKLFLAFLYGDLLMNLANRCRPYEKSCGIVDILVQKWIENLQTEITTNKYGNVSKTTSAIVNDFDALDLQPERKPEGWDCWRDSCEISPRRKQQPCFTY